MVLTMKLLATIAFIISIASARGAERHQVIVVGAGVAGFTAAATLLEHNVTDILVLEASDRIGGRIHTVEFGDVPIDKGGEFVSEGTSVFELLRPYDFLIPYETLVPADKFLFANTSGHGVHSIRIKEVIDKALGIFGEDAIINTNGSLADYFYPRLQDLLREEKVDDYLSEAICHIVTQMECAYIAADSLYVAGTKGDKEGVVFESVALKWKSGGFKTLFDIISKKFPNPSEELPVVNKTVFGKEVTRVEHREKDVEVTCADGSTYLADHVIVTVSLGVLKKHAAAMFQPALSAEKTTTIQTIKFGCLAKVFMLFPNRWWLNDTNAILPLFSQTELEAYVSNSTHGYWTANTTGFYPVMNNGRMLCAWLYGNSCRTMESLTDDQVAEGLVELLEALVGKMFHIPKPEKILRTSWASNPYTLGAYSHRSVESDRLNLTNDNLATPIMDGDRPVLLFAGEATHLQNVASVHGAYDTGRREALHIINYRKGHQQL